MDLKDEEKDIIASLLRGFFLVGNDMQNRKDVFLNRLKEKIIVYDGAMGTNLETLGLDPEHYGSPKLLGCNDHLNISSPQSVKKVHQSFIEVGVDVIETNTFRSNRYTLKEFGIDQKTEEINIAGARIAREAIDKFPSYNRKIFVAGSMGPTGNLLTILDDHALKQTVNFDHIRDAYQQQAAALIQGGVDILLIETAQDILELKAAILGIRDAFQTTGITLPIQAQVTLDPNGKMLAGTDINAVIAILSAMPIDILGLNCSTGPALMKPALTILSEISPLPISCLPNAGMPENINGKAKYSLSPKDFSEAMVAFIKQEKIAIAGGCCGTTPEHLRLLVEAAAGIKTTNRSVGPYPALSSAYHAFPIEQKPKPFIIGERLNTQGSKRFKRFMLQDDYQNAFRLAREQVAYGAHALDICSALTEDENEIRRTSKLVHTISQIIDRPIVIDSTDPQVMESALKLSPGRCLLNSINLENGTKKAETIIKLAKNFNAALIALTIDEEGMAKTAEKKLAIAERIAKLIVHKFGLAPSSIIFDPLTFTLGSGSMETRNAGVETLDGLRLIKSRFPRSFTILGVSNISFGLPIQARQILNSVFLKHAIDAGLDMAIINPVHNYPYTEIDKLTKQCAEELIFNKNSDALFHFLDCFQRKKKMPKVHERIQQEIPVEEKIFRQIINRNRENLENNIDTALTSVDHQKQSEKALRLLNQTLLPAMKWVGERFGSGDLILPFVLQSAEIMRAATDHLEQYFSKSGHNKIARIVLATVYGDVHDIGKNLVHTIIANNGYEVIDLGKQVAAESIINAAVEQQADAIGLSALLVNTSQQMPIIIEKLHDRKVNIPVLIGGAAVNKEFAQRIVHTSNGERYQGGVYYCEDAFSAMKVLSSLNKKNDQPTEIVKNKPDALNPCENDYSRKEAANMQPFQIVSPPFLGSKTIELPMDELFQRINNPALYRISWGAGKAAGEKWETYQETFQSRLQNMKEHILSAPWLFPKALVGFYHCRAEKNTVQIFSDCDGNDLPKPIYLEFPRQVCDPHLCLSDYFIGGKDQDFNILPLQLVTMGHEAVTYVQELNRAGDLVESYFAHGLAVQLTEAAAQYAHQNIRKILGLPSRQGKRYSWGYPVIPDLSQHEQIIYLLNAGKKLKIRLTSGYQFIPEYSTAALVVPHPSATFFNIQN